MITPSPLNRSLVILALLLGGCATTPTTPEKKAPTTAEVEESVQVNSLGSWIPRKVKKKADIIGDAAQVVDAEALNKINAQGSTRTVKEPGPR
jgi:PBP1b-binding outer membrane lipoprotein LpoB